MRRLWVRHWVQGAALEMQVAAIARENEAAAAVLDFATRSAGMLDVPVLFCYMEQCSI